MLANKLLAVNKSVLTLGTIVLHLKGDSFTDSSPNNMIATRNGNVSIDTSTAAMLPGCITFDGTGDYLSYGKGIDFLTGDFCIELEFYLTAYANNNGGFYAATFLNNTEPGFAYGCKAYIMGTASSHTSICFVSYSGGTAYTASQAYTFSLNKMHTVAIKRVGSVLTIVANGTSTTTTVLTSGTDADFLKIGTSRQDATYLQDFPGKIKNLIISK